VTATPAASLARVLSECGVLPVIELPSVSCGEPLCEALLAAGCRVAEITLRSAAGLEALPALRASCPDMLIGSGTVRSAGQAREAIDAGAQFVVSPSTDTEVIALCQSSGIAVIPGACTPTEIDLAARSGCGLLKFFPAAAMGGVATLSALHGPFREISFVPTGGIGPANLASYLRLPNVLACGGSWLVARDLLAQGRFDEVRERTREALAIARQARNEEENG
jgi:2-dehydro-3-deoxyphosphogluconate aldolase / (4S)-4-hydroxy-2-oxoglutarate aldolase